MRLQRFPRNAVRASAFLILALLAPVSGLAQTGPGTTGRLIVTFNPNPAGAAGIAAEIAATHGLSVRNVLQRGVRGMVIDPPASAALVDALRRDPRVAAVARDRVFTLTAETAPVGIRRVNAELGRAKRANTGVGVTVAVMDSGIDFQHIDLAVDTGRSVQCINALQCVAGGDDVYGHGTSVAGVIAALDNDVDLVGVAPQATLVSVRVFNDTGGSSSADILAGIDHIIGLNSSLSTRVDVVNMSFRDICVDNAGTRIDCDTDSDFIPLHTAIQQLVASGTTVVAGSGNDTIDTAFISPAGFSEVIAVSAIADSDGLPGGVGPSVCLSRIGNFCVQSVGDDRFAPFSNFGPDVDVTAPGADELLLANNGGTRKSNGTSFSSPNAAGVAAIFISHRKAQGLTWDPALVRQALIETGECYQSGSGAGSLIRGTVGCPVTFPGDGDTAPEPMVRADNVVNFSETSGVVPAAPGSLAATAVSSSQIDLVWADNSSNESGFKLERCQGAGCTNFAPLTTVGANTTTYSNTGLTASTSYTYKVSAYNLTGDSNYAPPASAITLAAPAVPSAPSNLTATGVSSTQINLAWTDNSSNETGFVIQRCKGATCTRFATIATVAAGATTYPNTGLTKGTYRYRVYATGVAGNSGNSNIATGKTR